MNKKSDIQNLANAAFVENNGEVFRMFNILTPEYHKLSEIRRVLAGRGMDEAGFIESVNFLDRAGYIELRDVASRTKAHLADWQYADLEGILTDKGIRLAYRGVQDNMIEV